MTCSVSYVLERGMCSDIYQRIANEIDRINVSESFAANMV
jgi:hypothetical protein